MAGISTARSVDDLASLNDDALREDQRWMPLRSDAWDKIEARVRQNVRVKDDFITVPFLRLASTAVHQIAEAAESYKREAAIVDARLAREVTCAFKATALSDLCDRLRADTGIQLTAGPSVADEKVTLFCEKLPLREVMRQLSRPFGYTWLRSKKEGGEYRYELVQDLRSQLLEEELRNRDRDAALIALDREVNRYRQFLGLSPDEALARAETAPPEEKALLANFAKDGWGPVQMYFRLSPPELAALRAGQKLLFSSDPGPGEEPLPADIIRGVLASMRGWRIRSDDGRFAVGSEKDVPDGLAPALVPEARAVVTLRIDPSELGQLTLDGGSGFRLSSPAQTTNPSTVVDLAIGSSPAARSLLDGAAGSRLIRDPTLRSRVSIQPEGHCWARVASAPDESPQSKIQNPKSKIGKVTTADVLEALHRASGLPIVADYYTRLYPLSASSVRDQPLLDALNQIAPALRLRWNKDGNWLQFRSATFFADRLKEVPNRLLFRWAASRRQHGVLTLDDLIEIAQLSDAQLDSKVVAEGIKECFGLAEWDLARSGEFRPHLRYLAQFTRAQRQAALSDTGLAFNQMSLAQQQQFIARLGAELQSVEQLTNASVRVEYTQPGWFRWEGPQEPAPSPVRERTREAALSAARRIDPKIDAAQIVPTELAVTVLYTWGGPKTGGGSLGTRRTPSYTRVRTDHFPARL